MQTYGYREWVDKYPNVKLIEGEDLNIYNMTVRTVAKCFHDKAKYRTISHIVGATGLSYRTVTRIISDHKLKKVNHDQAKKTGKVRKMLQSA